MTVPETATAPAAGAAVDITGLDRAGLEGFFTELGEKPFRARQVMQWLHMRGVTDFAAMTDLSKGLRARLSEHAYIPEVTVRSEVVSTDGTVKWLFGLADARAVEAVFIPDEERGTLCISSQAGCPLDCKFCATGSLGFDRNLTAGEILAQVRHARAVVGAQQVTNLVFMGMGEPLLNYDAVVPAVRILLDEHAYGMSRRRVTVSTVGVVPRMIDLGREIPVNLAISLHAVRNDVRDRIVPINRSYPLERLMAACRDYPLAKGRRITFEYVMLDGVNDSPDDADGLLALLAGVPAKVNLIPFNPFPGAAFERSADVAVEAFRKRLLDGGLVATTRTPRGEDIAAACGQLQAQEEGVA